ncbi:MAG: heparinase II/III family protein [Flavobacteriaceae bacterium]
MVLVSNIYPQKSERNLMTANRSVESISKIILEPEDWVIYPKKGEEWKKIVPLSIYNKQIETAEELLGKDWPVIKASVFLEYERNGNRTNYEDLSFERRHALSRLVMAEMLEGKGRFVDDIINLVWAICEETYWGLPAHIFLQESGSGLPDIENPSVDLFVAETGALLAWTDYMIGEKMDEVNPFIRERIQYETRIKIHEPYLKATEYKYMGYNKSIRRPNNWNPWINSNVMLSALLLEKNKLRRAELIYKIFEVLDNYLNPHPADGGCDEGPHYWNAAGASVFDCLSVIDLATNHKINLFSDPLIVNLGTYVYKAYVGNGYYLNFADAGMKANHSPTLLYRYGKAIDSEIMMNMAAYFGELQGIKNKSFKGSLGRAIPGLYYISEVFKQTAKEPLIRDLWLPDIQIAGGRDKEGSKEGLYFAAKGGHNEESHNHNDIGNFVVFSDGNPAIIDIGVETYTKKTFSTDRYDIWTMNSGYHNLLPTVNGTKQNNGIAFKATNVEYQATDKKVFYAMDISDSYPKNAGINKWHKEFIFLRGKSIVIKENYHLSKNTEGIETYLMTCRKPEIKEGGSIILPSYRGNDKKVRIKYDEKLFNVAYETHTLEDKRLISSWDKGEIYRIVFTMTNKKLSGSIKWEIELL